MIKKMIEMGKSKYLMLLGTTLLAVVLLFTILTAAYIQRFNKTLLRENEAHLAELAAHIAVYMQTVVEDTQGVLQTAADALCAVPETQRMDYLKGIRDRQGVIYVGYAWEDGMLHATEPFLDGDISEEEYYKKAMSGENMVSGLTRYILEDRVVSGIVLAAPVWNGEGEVQGVLTALLNLSQLEDALNVESYGGEGYSYIIDRDGNLVLHNKSMDYHNFFRVLGNVQIEEGGGLDTIRSNIEAGKSGIILYNQLGVARYAYYYPLGFNSWTVVNIVSEKVIMANTHLLMKELVAVSIFTVIIFMLLLTVVGVTWVGSQNQKHVTETKAAFLANVSHEIRTPMNVIVGMGEILLREPLEERQKGYVQGILNSSKNLLTLINDILDFSKMESGKFSILDGEYEVESLLHDIAGVAGIRIGDNPIEFMVDVEQSVPSRLIGDKTRIKQILTNIVGNAVKFTERGYIRMSLWAEKEAEGIRLYIKVEDTGIGIEEQDLDKLFVSFNQIDSRNTHGKEGTGLGLAISKSLSRMMNGNITAESVYGKGSVFTVSILQGFVECAPLLGKEGLEQYKLILLEEDAVLRGYYTGCLEQLKIDYKVCAGFGEFENNVRLGKYTHVMADRQMLQRLREKETDAGAKEIILIGQREYVPFSKETEVFSVYAPLFGIQLAAVLTDFGRKEDIGMASSEQRELSYVHILIVDDNELNREIEKALMEPYGMDITCAASGMEAVSWVLEKEFDLVFMDYMMPEMDGLETLKKIRELPGEYFVKIPVIALTANAGCSAREMFLQEGFDDFLAKPIEIAEVDRVLEKWLRNINEERKNNL